MLNYEDHTFVICAYKESAFLEECIKSLFSQTVKSNIIAATSTPNEHIKSLCERYGIPLFVNPNGHSSIGDDWNFAVSCCNTDLITVAHQDDIYAPDYLKTVLSGILPGKKQILFFTHYNEIKNGTVQKNGRNMKVKRFISKRLQRKYSARGKRFWLGFGCPIGCPAVTLNTKYTGKTPFDTEHGFVADWMTWYKLSENEGYFTFCDGEMMSHRIHEESETSKFQKSDMRRTEDSEMLSLFWPKPVASLIRTFFSKGEK